jgi:hypothetical protein
VNVSGLGVFATLFEFFPNLYDLNYKLNWHNCFSFGNGVESNRIRDNYNLPYIANGVKVSTTLEYDYKEEHRKYGLIYSGLYNAISGVNNLNQFIQAEKITKDINPIYGSIQKLHARDADLVTLCEDKVLKILSQKDALYNADGNINLTATERVLGQAIPFAGEYGISTNPESFASESYRAYFADRVRGAVLRLSMDGLTPISDAGMKDWFRDNLKLVNGGRIIGSYDDRNDEYVLKLEFLDLTTISPTGPVVTGPIDIGPVDIGLLDTRPVTVYGCTDPAALNYNSTATINDGSCAYISGNVPCPKVSISKPKIFAFYIPPPINGPSGYISYDWEVISPGGYYLWSGSHTWINNYTVVLPTLTVANMNAGGVGMWEFKVVFNFLNGVTCTSTSTYNLVNGWNGLGI